MTIPDNLFGGITPQPMNCSQVEIPNVIVILTDEQWQANREYARSDVPVSDCTDWYWQDWGVPFVSN